MKVLGDMSAGEVGPEMGLGRDTVKPSLCVDGKTKEPPVVVDVTRLRVAGLPVGLIDVVGALEVVGTFELVGSTKVVPPGVLRSVFELRAGRRLDETTDEVIVFDIGETVDSKMIVDSVETEVDNAVLNMTTLVDAGYDG